MAGPESHRPTVQHPDRPAQPAPPRPRWVLIGVTVCLLAAGLYWAIPYVHEYFTTLSTDDAFVNSHVTNVAPRVEDNVLEVLVEDGYFVEAGTVLVKLDPYPYQIVVD